MAGYRFDYTVTPTDERSITQDGSWKGSQYSGSSDKRLDKKGSWLSSLKSVGETDQNTGQNSNWKPLSMTSPILAAIVVLSALIAATIELLAQISMAQGGMALSPSVDGIPKYAMWSYLYGPTVIAVIYSLIWNWADLDVKRMQPWFELSRPEGAMAANSLFLEYPFDFIGFVPFKAAKRKHWAVFLSGTSMMVVFWLITPLQSSIFGLGQVAITRDIEVVNRTRLVPLEQQADMLNPEVLTMAYSTGWLGQPLPPFTTSDRAILPFTVNDKVAPAQSETKTNWTAVTTQYSTDLECWPAEYAESTKWSNSFDFLNGQGCNTTVTSLLDSNYTMLYIGYNSSPYSSFALANPSCPPSRNNSHQFLSIWTQNIPTTATAENHFKFTALYCQPYYYSQPIRITVSSSSLRPDRTSIVALSDRKPLPDSVFNRTAFEFLLNNGVQDDLKVRDYPFNQVVEQHPRLFDMNLTQASSNMVGYALAGRNNPISYYADPDVLHDIYENAHRYIFSLAVNQLLTNATDFDDREASTTFFMHGIVVSRVFSAIVEGLLLLVAVFTAILLWVCHRTECNLQENPSSLSRLNDIFRNSPDLLNAFRSLDNADSKALAEVFQHDRFRLRPAVPQGNRGPFIEIVVDDGSRVVVDRESPAQKGFYTPVRPFVLKREVGALFVAILMGAVVTLVYFQRSADANTGLVRPTQSFEVLQLLENYIPTVFATLVEPFWVLLNRMLCVLQPFKELWSGKAQSSRSIDATYTAVPPQLSLLRALKSRHFILVFVCTIALLANVLAVGLGALFNEATMVAVYDQTFSASLAPKFDNSSVYSFTDNLMKKLRTSSSYQDHFYVARANISSSAPLPPWTSDSYFFQPQDALNSKNSNETQREYIVRTRGYGMNPNCTSIPSFSVPQATGSRRDYLSSDTETENCPDFIDRAVTLIRDSGFTRSSGRSAVEYCNTLTLATGRAPCDRSLTLGWGRTPSGKDVNGTVEASFLICTPIFETAMFDVTVDTNGYVLSYKRAGSITNSLGGPDRKDQIDVLMTQTNQLMNRPGTEWHNDTITRDWINHLILETTGSRDALDPSLPPPDPKQLRPIFEKLYSQLFAILLQLNQQLFEPGNEKHRVTGQTASQEIRIFMDRPAFIISMVVLALNIIAAVLFYWQGVVFVLPRMPTSVGAILAYVASSRVINDHEAPARGQGTASYSFGRYIGCDGDIHIGIDKDPHVVPVDPTSFGRRPTLRNRIFQRKNTNTDTNPKSRGETWL